MGLIRIETAGSFGESKNVFYAQNNGHVDAVAQTIEFLSKELLPIANAQDHKLHSGGCEPEKGWDRSKV